MLQISTLAMLTLSGLIYVSAYLVPINLEWQLRDTATPNNIDYSGLLDMFQKLEEPRVPSYPQSDNKLGYPVLPKRNNHGFGKRMSSYRQEEFSDPRFNIYSQSKRHNGMGKMMNEQATLVPLSGYQQRNIYGGDNLQFADVASRVQDMSTILRNWQNYEKRHNGMGK